jgi:hypothetical protein
MSERKEGWSELACEALAERVRPQQICANLPVLRLPSRVDGQAPHAHLRAVSADDCLEGYRWGYGSVLAAAVGG